MKHKWKWSLLKLITVPEDIMNINQYGLTLMEKYFPAPGKLETDMTYLLWWWINLQIVGHLPKKISSTCSLFLNIGGSTSCKVTGLKWYLVYLIRGRLEIPCRLLLSARSELIDNAKKLLILCEQKIQIETSKVDSLVSTKSEKPNSQIKTQLAINGYPAKRFKLEDTDNPYTNDGDVSNAQLWLYHELGKVWLTVEDHCRW